MALAWWDVELRGPETVLWSAKDDIEVHCIPTPANKALLEGCPTLNEPYVRFPDPSGAGHLETLWGAIARTNPHVPFNRELVDAPSGGVVCLDWYPEQQASVHMAHMGYSMHALIHPPDALVGHMGRSFGQP